MQLRLSPDRQATDRVDAPSLISLVRDRLVVHRHFAFSFLHFSPSRIAFHIPSILVSKPTLTDQGRAAHFWTTGCEISIRWSYADLLSPRVLTSTEVQYDVTLDIPSRRIRPCTPPYQDFLEPTRNRLTARSIRPYTVYGTVLTPTRTRTRTRTGAVLGSDPCTRVHTITISKLCPSRDEGGYEKTRNETRRHETRDAAPSGPGELEFMGASIFCPYTRAGCDWEEVRKNYVLISESIIVDCLRCIMMMLSRGNTKSIVRGPRTRRTQAHDHSMLHQRRCRQSGSRHVLYLPPILVQNYPLFFDQACNTASAWHVS